MSNSGGAQQLDSSTANSSAVGSWQLAVGGGGGDRGTISWTTANRQPPTANRQLDLVLR